jgi:hypothetical protein
VCETYPGKGPGTPYRFDASQGLVDAVRRFDRGGDASTLVAAMSEARVADAFTLWHLLPRVDEPVRREVHARLNALVPAPAGRGEEALRLEQGALDAWWNEIIARQLLEP